jgi:hypothetical protein
MFRLGTIGYTGFHPNQLRSSEFETRRYSLYSLFRTLYDMCLTYSDNIRQTTDIYGVQ